MTKHYCDGCGKQINQHIGAVLDMVDVGKIRIQLIVEIPSDVELCVKCAEDAVKELANGRERRTDGYRKQLLRNKEQMQ